VDDQASRIERTMKPTTEQELKDLGATLDANGVWTFPDRSMGKFTKKPIAVFTDVSRTEQIGFAYFEKIERVQ
jgi:hypothetical protein